MQVTVKTEKNGTVVIMVQTTADEGRAARDQVVAKYAPTMNIQGFRPGKAPVGIVEKNLRTDKLAEETLSILATEGYNKAIIEHKLSPITQPSVSIPAAKDVQSAEESLNVLWPKAVEEGIEIEILTFINPEISLGKWEKAVEDAKEASVTIETATSVSEAKSKAKKGKKDEAQAETTEEPKEKTPQELDQELEELILTALIAEGKIDLPDALIRGEADHLLMHHVDTIQRLGISYQDYLKSQQKTIEEVHNELTVEAEKNLRVRFLLSEIAKEKREFFTAQATLRDVMDYLKKIAKGEKPEPLPTDQQAKASDHVHDHDHDHDHQH